MRSRSVSRPSWTLEALLVTGVGAAVAGTLALAGCSTSSGTTSSSSASSTASSSASASTSASASASASSGTSSDVLSDAKAFAATLSSSQKSDLQQDYSLSDAKRWSNLPQALLQGSNARIGLQLKDLSDAQQTALDTLLQTATGTASNEGWNEIQELWNADDYLNSNGGGDDYGRENYYLAFLGTPSDSGTWELQFGGHHLAVANTYIDGELVGATPSFRGVEPFATFTENGTSNKPLQQERAALSAMLTGLSSSQLSSAELSKTYSDLVLGPGNDWSFPTTKEGVKASALSDSQKVLVTAAMKTYVGDIDDGDAATILAEYENELDSTYIAYSGSTGLTTRNDYVRIDGPHVWIEYSTQNGIVLSGTHPHSVWRDRSTDYGGTKS